jgi:hypothetical protein
MIRVQFKAGAHKVQQISHKVHHPVSYQMDTGRLYPQGQNSQRPKLATQLHLQKVWSTKLCNANETRGRWGWGGGGGKQELGIALDIIIGSK